MRKWGIISGFSFVLFFLTLPSLCQLLPEEIAERQKWEDFLISANVVKSEQMMGPGSVTSPWHLTLEKDGITNDALWKDVQGRLGGYNAVLARKDLIIKEIEKLIQQNGEDKVLYSVPHASRRSFQIEEKRPVAPAAKILPGASA